MDPTIILGVLLLAPVIAVMYLRINAAQIFLSLCLGNVLVEFLGPDAAKILTSASANTHGTDPNLAYVNLFLLLLPVVTTAVIMIHSVHGRAKLAYNLLPTIGVSVLTVLLAVPLLSPDFTDSITGTELWHTLESLQTLILGLSTLLTLLFLWMQCPKKSHDGDKHHK